jgi:hypothetical protein
MCRQYHAEAQTIPSDKEVVLLIKRFIRNADSITA